MSLEDIARMTGLTKQGVQKIEQRALRKLRKALEKKGITVDDIYEEPINRKVW